MSAGTPDSSALPADPTPSAPAERPARPQYGEYATPEELAALQASRAEAEAGAAQAPAASDTPAAAIPAPVERDDAARNAARSAARTPDPVPGAVADRSGTDSSTRPTGLRRWDRPLTIGLLVFGALNLLLTGPSMLSPSEQFAESLEIVGVTGFSSFDALDSAGVALLIVHGILLIVAVALSLARLHAGRIAFWIPLTAGILAVIVMLVVYAVVIVGDPAFVEYAMQQPGR